MPQSHPLLVVLRGRLKGRQYSLERLPLLIGRGDDCDIRLPSGASSRHHARLEASADGKILLRDLDSRNGTQINNQLASVQVLVDGDQIQIGRTLLGFLVPTEAPSTDERAHASPRARSSLNIFDTTALAKRLSAWAAEWGACAVEFRFRHGRDSHACWVANDMGRVVLEEFFARLEQVSRERGVNPSVTEALVRLASAGDLEESDAYGWINGAPAVTPSPDEAQILEWHGVAEEQGWWLCDAPTPAEAHEAQPLDQARDVHARILGAGRSYLYVAIPEKAIRVSGRIDDIVLLHAIWAQEGTLVYEEAANSPSKVEFQRRVRDAATHFLIWTSVELLNRESRALSHWQRAWAHANLLFNEGAPRLHEPASWSSDDLAIHLETLQEIVDALKAAVEELGGELKWPRTITPGERWPLMVAKAISHRALHPLVLISLLEPWDALSVQETAELPLGVVVADDLEPIGLLKAFVALEASEGGNVSEPFFMDGQRHLVFMTDLRVRDRRERFTEAILFKQAAQGASTGHATRAFSGLRRFASSVAVEVEPDKHDLGLVVRFPRERYSAP
ncbi:MAG: hypothetical protein CMH57_09510 [Myxococcales bacterium]|nr:hypothetical protein [Myxococcales bacterium]